jgi:hypothetical protein
LYDAILELAKADFKGMLDDEISKDMEDESAVILNVNFYIPLHGDDIGNIILQFKEDMDECGYTFDILETRLEED